MDADLKRRIEDLASRQVRTNQAAATMFLDPAELVQARGVLARLPGVRWFDCGGFDDAERKRIFLMPDYLDEDIFPKEEYLSVLRAACPSGAPGHRDWLGSLMGLGVKRETLGDILVFPKYADIICTRQISGFICSNLTRVGRLGISLSEVELSDIVAPTPEFEKRGGTVASLRLDAVCAIAFGVSRSTAAQLIREGRLALDHVETTSPSAEVSEGNLLSLRGYGRAKLFRVGGMSKKGRLFVELHAYTKK